jgi:hypothetical protein
VSCTSSAGFQCNKASNSGVVSLSEWVLLLALLECFPLLEWILSLPLLEWVPLLERVPLLEWVPLLESLTRTPACRKQVLHSISSLERISHCYISLIEP